MTQQGELRTDAALNTQLFAKDGSLVRSIWTPPVKFDAITWRGRLFVRQVGRFVEAVVYESKE